MIRLRVIPLSSLNHQYLNLLSLVKAFGLLNLFCHTLDCRKLSGRVIEDGRAILRADIGALAVQLRGIVHSIKELDKCAVADPVGIKVDTDGFGVVRVAKTDLVGKQTKNTRVWLLVLVLNKGKAA